MTEEIRNFISTVGFPITLVLLIGWVIVRCGRFLSPIIKNAIERVVNAHVQFVEHQEKSFDNLTASQDMLAKTAERAHTIAADRQEVLKVIVEQNHSRIRLHEAAHHVCDILDIVCEKLMVGDETDQPRQRIREALDRPGEICSDSTSMALSEDDQS